MSERIEEIKRTIEVLSGDDLVGAEDYCEDVSYLLKLEQSLQEDIMMLKDMVSTARSERDEIKLLVDTPKLNLLQQRDNERIAKNKALSETGRIGLELAKAQQTIAQLQGVVQQVKAHTSPGWQSDYKTAKDALYHIKRLVEGRE